MSWLQKDAKRLVNTDTHREDVHFFNPALCVFNYIECRVCSFRRFSDGLGQDGYFWVDKALWVTISIIILNPLSPRSNFKDGGEAASLFEETRFV